MSPTPLPDSTRRWLSTLAPDDLLALKLCLLSTGALAGLSLRRPLTRRLAALGCSFLAAGLAVPLVSQYLDTLRTDPEPLHQKET